MLAVQGPKCCCLRWTGWIKQPLYCAVGCEAGCRWSGSRGLECGAIAGVWDFFIDKDVMRQSAGRYGPREYFRAQ